MRFYWRQSIDTGLVRWNFTQRGYSSYTVRVFLWTSWNSRSGWKFNPPGPGWFSFGPKPQRRRRAR